MKTDELITLVKRLLNTDDFDEIHYSLQDLLDKLERESAPIAKPRMSPQERTRSAVYATGNKWAIENFNATH